ncbi:nucleotide-binding universal stress UspA family protein [Mariniflexile fucanivorans]|uniref:Nucleotide-binding universal stress UspA family protein n=1 Tax=Mariniflexile fucanivorans TaxID=264023 RepID=A0A4R1RHN7_9FLAO|nr:universal stress protein [Mariniflexile fucanivorans]TCL65595.1 nucleotide-binding universal stress UspA family protein [Mariniflexile fucanivorans]
MKNILLPTDFSENSWNAIKYALQLFKNETCKFYLLNTYTPVIYHVEYVLVEPAQFGMIDNVREIALKNLEDFKTRIKSEFKNPKHTIETIGAFNMLIPEIVEIVKDKAIDYVVMGTKGATGTNEILFGSNTVHVFKNVKCPVLAIPDGFEFETPHEILFPTDYAITYETHHVKPIIDINKLYQTRIHILYLTYGYDLSEKQEENKLILETHLKKETYLIHEVGNQTVEEGITNFQSKTRVNMLVMINNKHSFFENLFFKNTINQIGFHLKIPFLVIPAKL